MLYWNVLQILTTTEGATVFWSFRIWNTCRIRTIQSPNHHHHHNHHGSALRTKIHAWGSPRVVQARWWNLSEIGKSFHSGCTSRSSVQCWFYKDPGFPPSSSFRLPCWPFVWFQRKRWPGRLCVTSLCDWLLLLSTDCDRFCKWRGTFSKCFCIFSEVLSVTMVLSPNTYNTNTHVHVNREGSSCLWNFGGGTDIWFCVCTHTQFSIVRHVLVRVCVWISWSYPTTKSIHCPITSASSS